MCLLNHPFSSSAYFFSPMLAWCNMIFPWFSKASSRINCISIPFPKKPVKHWLDFTISVSGNSLLRCHAISSWRSQPWACEVGEVGRKSMKGTWDKINTWAAEKTTFFEESAITKLGEKKLIFMKVSYKPSFKVQDQLLLWLSINLSGSSHNLTQS